ncbi:peptidase domain-containing ABC transporter [Luteibacter yeojuensis]|uniref:ABC transporter n=1 Tax=Luteibacter yeojuensis TaxID=345309 RepID=A0A0F3KXH6_9GAMM|nr:peptidase domain-containing ABC transporter [Luteibacter yeojuensis]KJV34814.1 ABC transporter [Luteibacter yeojuensis]
MSEFIERLNFGLSSRLPVIRQSEVAECGMVCLAMVAAYHGQHHSLAALRQRFALSVKGTDLAQLIAMADGLGFAARPVRLEVDELAALRVPCILHWDMDHFVVLKAVRGQRITVHDPAVGAVTMSLRDFSAHFTGVALELLRGATFARQAKPPPVSLHALAGSVRGLWKGLGQILALALVLELAALLAPQYLQIVVDQVLADDDHDLLAFLGYSFAGLLVVQTLVSALRSWTVVWLSTSFNLGWTGNVFQHLLKLPQDYFLKRHLGDIVSRFGAVSAIQQTLTTRFIEVLIDGTMAALTLVLLFVYSIPLAMIAFCSVVVYAALRLLYFRTFREAKLNLIMVNAKQQTTLMESIRGSQAIRLQNGVARQTGRFLNATADALNTSVTVQRLTLIFQGLGGLSSGAQRIAILWLGASLALKGEMSAGMLMAFVAYADQFSARASSMIDYGIELRMLRLQAERLADIVLTPQETSVQGTHSHPSLEPSLTFKNVAFRYGAGEPWVLEQCNFEVHPGECVAIVGASGAGKSTLLRLMVGLLDPLVGEIHVGGMDLRKVGKSHYRAIARTVMQDDHLFAGSISENIAFFAEEATPERVERAARLAALHEDILAMPMGYHTLVGDMGSSLSGGQQQRLLLARALYAEPKILVLDEATSHLDLPRERAIAEMLSQLKITRVVVAHRAETVAAADRVLVLSSGRLTEARRQWSSPPGEVLQQTEKEESNARVTVA